MKKIILLFVVSFFTFSVAICQYIPQLKGKASLYKSFRNTTLVVLTGNEKIDNVLKKSVETYWKITPFEFIDIERDAKLLNDVSYNVLCLKELEVKGGKKNVKAWVFGKSGGGILPKYLNNALAFVSLDNLYLERKDEDHLYRLPHIIFQLNEALNLVNENDITANSMDLVFQKMDKEYVKNATELQNKTLLIDADYTVLKITSMEDFAKKYGYAYEVVPKATIEAAIRNKDESKAYLVSAVNEYKISTVTDCATGKILYASFVQEDPVSFEFSPQFNFSDMGKLGLAAKKGK